MGRRVHFNFSGENKSFDEVDKTYQKVISSLDYKYSKEKNKNYVSTFFGLSEEEVAREYYDLTNEVGCEFCLAMFASVESILRTDFIIRCELKKSDNLSKYYRNSYKPIKRMYSYGLTDVILKGWKEYLPNKYSYLGHMHNPVFDPYSNILIKR